MLCTSVGERSAVCGSTGTPRGPIRRHQIRLRPFWSWCRRWRGPEKKPRPPAGLQLFTAGTKACLLCLLWRYEYFFIVQSSGVWSPHGGFHINQINQSIRQSIHLLLLRPSSHPTFFLFRSAGIGRTGCFIATSILCKQLRTEGVVDILRTTCQLRLDRWGILRIYPSSPLSLVLGTESLSSVDLVPKRRVTGSHCGVEIEMLTKKF